MVALHRCVTLRMIGHNGLAPGLSQLISWIALALALKQGCPSVAL
jgi:hypothetical protein